MSVSYWGIVGYGVCLDDIDKYLDREKINILVRKANPDIEFEEDVFDDYTFCGDPYSNLGEFLCELDDRNILSWDDDGNGRGFLLYEPIYPWLNNPSNQPKSMNETKDHIISVLKKVCDATYEELSKEIDFISTWGCG